MAKNAVAGEDVRSGRLLYDEVLVAVRELRDEVVALRGRLRDGNIDPNKDIAKVQADLRYWLKQSIEMESALEQIRQDAGDADAASNVDTLREDIRCRLNRLRECCGSE